MRDIKITTNLSDHEPKLIAMFTGKQVFLLFFSVGGYILVRKVFGSFMSDGASVFLALIFGLPSVLIGWIKPYGLKFEEFFVIAMKSVLIDNPKRVYRTENFHKKIYDEINNEEKEKIKSNKKDRNNKRKKRGRKK